ncbi:MAG: FtsX-like permease family protein [Blautia sp.]
MPFSRYCFFLVAALISLTTMTRMVEEERTQIGTLKALGYSKSSIAGKYVFYALLATVGGSVLGVLAGEKIFPYVIIDAYRIMYQHMDGMVLDYQLDHALVASLVALFCTMAGTLSACGKELASTPAVLMRPPAPKEGKRVFLERIGFIWKHLSFSWKSTVRNLFRYKKRLFMTVFGIGGCMALLLVGFGLRDSIMDVVLLQYGEIQLYDGMLVLNEDASDAEVEALKKDLSSRSDVEESMDVYMKKHAAKGRERYL